MDTHSFFLGKIAILRQTQPRFLLHIAISVRNNHLPLTAFKDEFSKALPTPIFLAWQALLNEKDNFRQLHRVIDAFEVLVKFASIVSVQNFYQAGAASNHKEVDEGIREKISRPSLGDWIGFLRVSKDALASMQDAFTIPELRFLGFEETAGKLGSLRNDYRGHGSTVGDDRAAELVGLYRSHLEALLASCAFFSRYPLCFVMQKEGDQAFRILRLMGSVPETASSELIHVSKLPVGHLIILNTTTGLFVDLYPLLIFESRARILFFNSLKNRAADFLDYPGDHLCLEAPNPVPSDFHKLFPRHQPRDASIRIEPNWFADFIDETTEHFVGRQRELGALSKFAVGGIKRAFVVMGPPGQGKTTLLARWAKEETVVRHFIREGDTTSDPAQMFENLGMQLSKLFAIEWKRPTTNDAMRTNSPSSILLSESTS